jgi:hypothetical protein
MKASLKVQKEVYAKCLTLAPHNVKALATTQLKDTDERKEVYQAYLAGWHPLEEVDGEDVPKLVSKPDDAYIARKYLQVMENAQRRGKDFDLSLSDVRKLLSVKKCAYTGVPLYVQLPNKDEKIPHGRTFDRLDPNQGYVKGNVYSVSHVANQIKNILFEDKSSIVHIDFKDLTNMVSNLSKLGFDKEV